MELWNRGILEGIVKSLGGFISLEENHWEKEDCRVFKLLVQ